MRSAEFLKEDKTTLDPEDEHYFQAFLSNCSDYFSFNKNPHLNLWRGERQHNKVDFLIPLTRKVIEGRKPTDTPEIVHDAFNDEFVTYLDYPFRSGLMCTGSPAQAADYGTPRIIVPCNGFTLCYSTVYSDMYADAVTPEMADIAEKALGDDFDYHDERDLKRLVNASFRLGKYQAGLDNLVRAIQSNNEVMLYPIDGIELNYYVFSENFWQNVVAKRLETVL